MLLIAANAIPRTSRIFEEQKPYYLNFEQEPEVGLQSGLGST